MIFTETSLPGSYIIEMVPFTDDRGWFARMFCKKEFAAIGHSKEWVQINHSYTAHKGVIRGMHFQKPPYTEIKLVHCITGTIFDVIIDVRQGSPTFLHWFGVELSRGNKKMLYIPEGFAHGFQTLEDHCELLYCHSNFYTPGYEGAILFNDPKIKINWPMEATYLSDKDKQITLVNEDFKGIKF